MMWGMHSFFKTFNSIHSIGEIIFTQIVKPVLVTLFTSGYVPAILMFKFWSKRRFSACKEK